jgi:hypothetical protein
MFVHGTLTHLEVGTGAIRQVWDDDSPKILNLAEDRNAVYSFDFIKFRPTKTWICAALPSALLTWQLHAAP